MNKPTVILNKFRENYIQTFSPSFLFLHTEASEIYSIWGRGRIYFFDSILIILGLYYIFNLNKSGALFVTSLLLIGALPGGIGGSPYSARNLFMSLVLPIFSAAGALFLVNRFKKINIRVLVVIVLGIFYAYFLGSYLYDYYGRYNHQSAEAWAKSLKDVSNIIIQKQNKYNTIVVGPFTNGDVVQFAFYAKLSPQELQTLLKNKDFKGPFIYKKITFVPECPTLKSVLPDMLLITRNDCEKITTPSSVIRDYWLNELWREYSQ